MQPAQAQPDPNQFGDYSDWAKENLAKGVSTDTLNQTLQQHQAQPENQPKQSGDLWSTVGGIALPVLGALLAPETGGASLLASTALSGLGGMAGKAVDKAAAGENPVGEDLIGAGLTNAVGNLVGGGLAKGAGAIAQGVVKPAADKVAASLVEGQGKGALDNATAQYLYKNGVTDLRQMGDIHPVVTGQEGALTNAVNNSLRNAADEGTRLDLSSLTPAAKGLPGETVLGAVRDAGIAGDSNSVKSVQEFVQGQLEKYNQGAITRVPVKGGGTLDSFDNGVLNAQHPLDALNMTKAMDSRAADWIKSSSPNIQAQGKALRNISNTVKDGLYGEGTSIGKTGITDQVRQTAIDELAPLREINPTYYEAKVNEVNGANTLADLRTAQKPEVIANQALDAANHAANTSGGTDISNLFKVGAPIAGMSVGGPLGLAAGLVAPKVLGSNAANVTGAGTLSKLSNVIGNEKAGKVMNTLGRMGGVVAANVPSMGAAPTNQSVLGGLPSNQGETSMNQTQPSQLKTILDAMQAQAVLAPQLNPNATSFLSSFAPQLQKNALVQNATEALPAGFGNAGGAQGASGIGSVLSGLVPGTAANAYQGESTALAAQLGQALGISPEAAQNLLPGLLQSTGTAGQRQNVLGGLTGALPS